MSIGNLSGSMSEWSCSTFFVMKRNLMLDS